MIRNIRNRGNILNPIAGALFLGVQGLVLVHYFAVDHCYSRKSEQVQYSEESEDLCALSDYFYTVYISKTFNPGSVSTHLFADLLILPERSGWDTNFDLSLIHERGPPESIIFDA